ncbi:MAG: ribose-phosphate diphosphokinase [Spirochaetota bacterium]
MARETSSSAEETKTLGADPVESFITPEQFVDEQARRMESNEGPLLIASCRDGNYMALRVVEKYQELVRRTGNDAPVLFLENIDRDFSDTETGVRLPDHVGGADVFIFQALLSPPNGRSVNNNYMALLLAARAFREHGANRITAVLPYLTYARQDKPTKFQREPTAAKLMADLSRAAGIDRVIAWHPHSNQIHGFYADMPVNMLDPQTMFTVEYAEFRNRSDVITVAPDAGATKMILHFSRKMGVNSAIASKYRPQQEEAVITDIIGDFRQKKTAIVLDDMISSGNTIFELVQKLVDEKGIERVFIGASHNLCLPGTRGRLQQLHDGYNLERVTVTNSIPQTAEFEELPFFHVRCLSEILCRTINRVHYNRSVSHIFQTR